MKIKTIEVKNFKAINEQKADFNGCSAIITAGNNKGKTSLLRGLIDRIRGEKPEIIVKQGEEKGYSIIELTDGSKIQWNFSEKSENFAFITKEGVKQTTGVISMISEKIFGKKFDVDKFINSTPKEQSLQLQKILGIDFSDIDLRYKQAYDNRTIANAKFKEVAAQKVEKPEIVEKTDIESLLKEKDSIMAQNEQLRKNWKVENDKHLKLIESFNKTQSEISDYNNDIVRTMSQITQILDDSKLKPFFDFDNANAFISCLQKAEPQKPYTSLPEPEYTSLFDIENKIAQANKQLRLYDSYTTQNSLYEKWIQSGINARNEKEQAEKLVYDIENEKKQILKTAKIPEGFEITDNGLYYNGFPLSNSQLSSSSKYIAALKLGAELLGELKTLHFDASFLDNISLSEIEKWAKENDLQLLIERPDLDGGEIKYQIIEL